MFDSVCLFIFGLILLIKGGDVFVERSADIARRLHLPDFIIGATVISAGTAMPEVMVSSMAAVRGCSDIAYGNVLGSVICNTALVAGLGALLRPCRVERRELILPSVFFFSSAAMFAVCAYALGRLPRPLGILLLSVFVLFAVAEIFKIKRCAADRGCELSDKEEVAEYAMPKNVLMILASIAVITVGAVLVNNNIGIIADGLGISHTVAGITLVALGTSLPELSTATVSLIKGRGSLSLGNIIGSNLFNFVLVGGISVTAAPFGIPERTVLGALNFSLAIDFPVMILCTAVLTVPVLVGGRLGRVQGGVLIALYLLFVLLQYLPL